MDENFFKAAVSLSLVLSIVAVTIAYWNLKNTKTLNNLRKTFFAGQNGAELEHILFALSEHLEDLQRQQQLTQAHLEHLRTLFHFAVQKVGLVKFNPFADVGGSFSFSLALLDEDNNGIILTNMHGRERNRIYTKKISQGISESTLTEEEQRAVEIANQMPESVQTKTIKQKRKS